MPYCTINRGTLYYEIHGEGEPLLLIAGLASDVQSWITVKKPLASRYKLILFDNRGVGRTTFTPGTISIEQMTEDVVRLLEHLEIKQTHVLGHSMGGMVAMNLSLKHPELVKKSVLAATSAKVNMRNTMQFRDWATFLKEEMDMDLWFKNLFYWLYSDALFEKTSTIAAYLIGSLNYPYPIIYESFNQQVEAAIGFDFTQNLSRITVPTLVLLAEDDKIFPVRQSSTTLGQIPQVSLKTIAEAGHSLHIEQPQATIKEVIDFLQ